MLVVFNCQVRSQDIYVTRNATLTFAGIYNEDPVKGMSEDLTVRLDYERAIITVEFLLSSVKSEKKTLNEILSKSRTRILMTGYFNIEYISTEDHSPMEFAVEGYLEYDNIKMSIEGTGELHHIGDGNSADYACMLGLRFGIDLKNLGMSYEDLEGIDNHIEVIMTQALLRRDKR